MNKYNPNIHHRRSIRLKGYDYSRAGLYFITICVQNRKCLFGDIENGEMILNAAGKMANDEWRKIPERFSNVQLHEYVVMPNHFHAIMEIVGATLVVARKNETVAPNDETVAPNDEMVAPNDETVSDDEKGQPQGIAPTKTKTVGDIVGAYQSIVTVEYIRGVKQLGWQSFNGKLWQRNYHEHIIRDKQSYQRISEYIINNSKNWKGDKFYKH
ncbi:MAG: transposase [Daejeonella sp.]